MPSYRELIAQRVAGLIPVNPANRAGRISGIDLATQARLAYQDVVNVVAYLRDHYPDRPLLSSSWGYWWSDDPVEVEAYQRLRAGQALTMLRRTYRGAVRPLLLGIAARDPGRQVEVRRRLRDFERLLEDIEQDLVVVP